MSTTQLLVQRRSLPFIAQSFMHVPDEACTLNAEIAEEGVVVGIITTDWEEVNSEGKPTIRLKY